jgi:cytochrome bd-type quinol oxidase subunit 2
MMMMKKALRIFLIPEAVIILFCFIVNGMKPVYDTGFTIGLLNLLLGVIMLLVAIVLLIAKQKENGMATLTAAGLVLLLGIVTCSVFPFRLY